MKYLFLALAIVGEVAATTALKSTAGFTRLWPSLAVILGYGCAFFMLSLVVQRMPVAVVYAIWCGGGIVLVALTGTFWLKQPMTAPVILGIALILAGTIIASLART